MIITLQNNDVTYKSTSFDYINNNLWLVILYNHIKSHYTTILHYKHEAFEIYILPICGEL